MNQILRFSGAVERDPNIDTWMQEHAGELGATAKHWFDVIRACGNDVRELLHDGHPTACIADAGFAYVNAFKAHVNVGFFRGALLPDPAGLLEGTGKRMRHVKLRPGVAIDTSALADLVQVAYADMKRRLDPPLASMEPPVPELPVVDVERAQRHYRDALGFEIGWLYPDKQIGAVARGDVGIFFRKRDPPFEPAVHWVHVQDLDGLYRELMSSGANIVDPLERKPWGLRQFTVADLDGNRFYFHCQ